jgi:maltokinase
VTVFDSTARLMDMLAGWLPQQRWFPGRGTALSELAIVSDVTLLAGDPALRHLILETPLRGGTGRFQVPVGYRSDLPSSLAGALIGRLPGVACYDALHDPELADVLLCGINEQRLASRLRFVREPAAPAFGHRPDARQLGAEQSNTSLVFGDQAILKVLRRLFPGANPDLEVADALARLGSTRVAAPYGWIETDLDGEPVLLAVLSQYLAGASDGWTLALENLRRLYARHGAYGQEYLTEPVPACAAAAGSTASAGSAPAAGAAAGGLAAGEAAADGTAADGTAAGEAAAGAAAADGTAAGQFADEARMLGAATAELHADLATAFGSRDITPAELAGLAGRMNRKLAEAVTMVPELRKFGPRIFSAYAAVARLTGPVSVQRIHGDYHLGQVLRGQQGWVALDFEGEPAVPLAQRRVPAPALRDVAGMLRSFDYAARHQLIGQPDGGRVAAVAGAWVRQCQAAFCAGYTAGGGCDPDGHGTLLRALMLEKAVYEVIYESRHRPSWLSIPLDFVAVA